MDRVAVIYQSMLRKAKPLAEHCLEYLSARGQPAALYSSWDLTDSVSADGLSLAVTFGGDGTILRVARWLAASNVPIVGVKMGRLGFLAELLPEQLPASLDPYLARDYWLDPRTMLRAEVLSADGPAAEAAPPFVVLNDVVVSRGTAGRSLRGAVEVDGTELVEYTADGVIVATATGSTAYSFAAGGPILTPELPNLVVTPICPHLHGINGLVLPPDVTITIRVSTPQPAAVSGDGQIDLPLRDGQAVVVRAAPEQTLFARRGSRPVFYRSLVAKLR